MGKGRCSFLLWLRFALLRRCPSGEIFAATRNTLPPHQRRILPAGIQGQGAVSEFTGLFAISALKKEGYLRLGVNFESFNPAARRFWLKYFTTYTNSVVRRIDACNIIGQNPHKHWSFADFVQNGNAVKGGVGMNT